MEIVRYNIGTEGRVTPADPLPSPPAIPRGAVVVIVGRAPAWRHGMAVHRLHGSPAAAVAISDARLGVVVSDDPRLGAVIVASYHPDYHEGQVIPLG